MHHQDQIREHMEVVGSCGNRVGTVDRVVGGSIKLTRGDAQAGGPTPAAGEHHFLPMDWVARVDDKVHLNKPCDEVQLEWETAPLATAEDS